MHCCTITIHIILQLENSGNMSGKETLKQRKQTVNDDKDLADKHSSVGDNRSDVSLNHGLWGTIVDVDQGLSSMLAVCASRQSSAGHMRPFMMFLEYTCHGVPWLAGVAVWILVSHDMILHEKLINFFSSK